MTNASNLIMRIGDWVIYLSNESRPKELMIEISTYCNYACIHCFRYGARDFKQCFMSKDLFMRVINEAKRVGVRRIIFSGWGEPTTHPNFIEFY
ncbi:MAG: radical SAM protein, partial [Sulfolobales archaeon]